MNTSPAILTHLCFHVTLTIMLTVYCEKRLKLSTIQNRQKKNRPIVLSQFFSASMVCKLTKKMRLSVLLQICIDYSISMVNFRFIEVCVKQTYRVTLWC